MEGTGSAEAVKPRLDFKLRHYPEVEDRILVTLDTDFAELIYVRDAPHAGLVRLPDVPVEQRVDLMVKVLERHREALETRAVITVRGDRIRISRPPRVRAVSQE